MFIDNGRLRLEIDPQTGWIQSLRDLSAGVEVFTGAGARPIVLEDPSDTWSHNCFRFDRTAGEFRAQRVQLLENGPVRTTLRVESQFGSSTLVQDFLLYRGSTQVEVRARIDWHERHKLLKLRFPLHLSHMRATYEIPYGTIERFANGEEDPGQSWVDVSGLSRETGALYGFALLNDGKYSFDVDIRDLGMTVLRSPIAAHHIPAEPQPEVSYPYLDQGTQEFQYVLQPHAGSWEQAETVRRAAELNQPSIVQAATFHPEGTLPLEAGYIQVEPENVVVTVLKQAEDSQDLIVRAYESTQNAVQAEMRLLFCQRVIRAEFHPAEIKTFRVPRDPSQPVVEVNLLEDPE
jgi:alpha-mannosidase